MHLLFVYADISTKGQGATVWDGGGSASIPIVLVTVPESTASKSFTK